ncbi:MAG: DUF402 domain-containing protein [Promethearchaeota archaeon]
MFIIKEKSINARIRGVFSTALSRLLVDNDFRVTQSSDVILKRLDLEEEVKPPELEIWDLQGKQGVFLTGSIAAVKKAVSILKDVFLDVIVRSFIAEINAIYKGTVKGVDYERMTSFVDLGDFRGLLSGKILEVGKNLLVKIIRPEKGRRGAIVSDEISIPGKFAIIIPNDGVRISRRIMDGSLRKALYSLGRNIKPEGWGILWRTAAAYQDTAALTEEVNDLKANLEDLMQKAEVTKKPTKLLDGLTTIEVEFPAISKKKLDEIREGVSATIANHHMYKAAGLDFAIGVDLAEKLIARIPKERDLIKDQFTEIFRSKLPKVGEKVAIEHVKLDGRVIHLSPGYVVECDATRSNYLLKRYFRGGGTYDGLEIPMEDGDYALTKISEGEWALRTTYFSANNELKGEYYNISTPIEIYPERIRYVDLEADVIKWPDGQVKTVDLEELREATSTGVITQALEDQVVSLIEDLRNRLKASKKDDEHSIEG